MYTDQFTRCYVEHGSNRLDNDLHRVYIPRTGSDEFPVLDDVFLPVRELLQHDHAAGSFRFKSNSYLAVQADYERV